MPSPDPGSDAVPGIQVIEVNGVAAWQGLQRVTDFNIARAIVDDLLDRCLARAAEGVRPSVPARA